MKSRWSAGIRFSSCGCDGWPRRALALYAGYKQWRSSGLVGGSGDEKQRGGKGKREEAHREGMLQSQVRSAESVGSGCRMMQAMQLFDL